MNIGDALSVDKVQQLKCSICFPNVVPTTLIKKKTRGKKGIITYNKGYGTDSIKQHVDFEHPNLAIYIQRLAFISILGSQSKGDGEGVAILHAKKHFKVALGVISTFFRSNIPYSKHDETLKFFLEDLMLLITKGHLLFSTCENIWM
jgi:hypothetical protein